ncbi:MAG: hypothetical protein WCE61_16665 [Candidatus Acidiferrum sp.]
MPALHNQQPWHRKTLALAVFVLDMANKFKKRARVELFDPPRQCPQCKNASQVFVQPMNLCAPCWSYGVLSKIASTDKKLDAAA